MGQSGGSPQPTEMRKLERVAEIYRAALAAGNPPTRAVEEAFDVPGRTGSRLVSRARKAGLLAPLSTDDRLGVALRRRENGWDVSQPLRQICETFGFDPENVWRIELDVEFGVLIIAYKLRDGQKYAVGGEPATETLRVSARRVRWWG